MIDDHVLDAIEMRALAATREPWQVQYDPGQHPQVINQGCAVVASTYLGPPGHRRDAEFIAAARTDIPALIAEVRRLRGAPPTRRQRVPVWRWVAMLSAFWFLVVAGLLTLGGVAVFGMILALVGTFILGALAGGSGDART